MKILKNSSKPPAAFRPRKRKGRARKGEGSLKLRGKVFWYVIADPRHPGKKISESCRTSDYEEALKEKAKALVKYAKPGSRLAPLAIGDLLNQYGNYVQKEKAGSWRSIRTAIRHLRKSFGHLTVGNLTTADADQFRDDRCGEDGVTDSTVNRELGYLRAAMRREMKTTPPRVTSIPYMRTPSEKDCVREGFLEREDYVKILMELDPALRAIFVCAFHTGARAGELKMIQWRQVDFRGQGVIELRPKTTKNKDGRWLPFWGDMREYLERQKDIRDRELPDCPWVFFWPAGYHQRTVAGERLKDFRYAWKEAVTRAGYPKVLFHDLRRSAIRYADQNAGISSKRVRMMSGHKTESVYQRYNIGDARDIAQMGRDLDEHLRKQTAAASGKMP